MSDETIICNNCGRSFTWSYGEQRYYRERGLTAPKRCPTCRSHRRYEKPTQPFVQSQPAPKPIPIPPKPAPPPISPPERRSPIWPGIWIVGFGVAAVIVVIVYYLLSH